MAPPKKPGPMRCGEIGVREEGFLSADMYKFTPIVFLKVTFYFKIVFTYLNSTDRLTQLVYLPG